ncbi:hypothetical protein ACMCNP_05905 [Candidatus Acidulodesulfobacterium sp. H_13]|uniref:hypothetical protein n=1 Tax=Candidatus Acidulodesulfobacterium sp. H_13 TaxID=3395470 RepID=UPI003AF8CEA8
MRYFILLLLLSSSWSVVFNLSVFLKSCYGLNEGKIYNRQAQNIVNTADLIIKAEHARLFDKGSFADLDDLERERPPYLSPMAIYDRNGEGCIKKKLFKNSVYICIELRNKKNELNIFIPKYSASSDIVSREISKGITGAVGQIVYSSDAARVSFALNKYGMSHADSAVTVSSTLMSPNVNGGISYADADIDVKSSLLSKIVKTTVGFLTSILTLF